MYFTAGITEMYPRMPREQAADPVGSSENSCPLDSLISSEGLGQSMGDDWIHGIYCIIIQKCT
jgi:hypothetical protein